MGVERAEEHCKARGTLKERHNKGARFKTEAGESHRTTSCARWESVPSKLSSERE